MVRVFLNSSWPYYCVTGLIISYYFAIQWFSSYFYLLWMIYAVIPLADSIIPLDEINPTKEEEQVLERQIKWKVPLVLYMVIDWTMFFWGFHHITTNSLSYVEYALFTLSIGHVGGLGIVVSHEIMHKRDALSRIIGTFQLSKSMYMHFFLEHIYGHHKHVATPLDPATSKLNQSVYNFIPISIIGGYFGSWKREKELLERKNCSVWSVYNRMVWFTGLYVVIPVVIGMVWGMQVLVFFLLQALCSVLLLEVTNYLEHYGLQRKEISPGVYEQVNIKHSWNAPNLVQNVLLLKLQRHSDHHANSYKPYQTLSSYKESPSLPQGYAVCITASLIPPVWYSILNPLVAQTNEMGKPKQKEMDSARFTLNAFVATQTLIFSTLQLLL